MAQLPVRPPSRISPTTQNCYRISRGAKFYKYLPAISNSKQIFNVGRQALFRNKRFILDENVYTIQVFEKRVANSYFIILKVFLVQLLLLFSKFQILSLSGVVMNACKNRLVMTYFKCVDFSCCQPKKMYVQTLKYAIGKKTDFQNLFRGLFKTHYKSYDIASNLWLCVCTQQYSWYVTDVVCMYLYTLQVDNNSD